MYSLHYYFLYFLLKMSIFLIIFDILYDILSLFLSSFLSPLSISIFTHIKKGNNKTCKFVLNISRKIFSNIENSKKQRNKNFENFFDHNILLTNECIYILIKSKFKWKIKMTSKRKIIFHIVKIRIHYNWKFSDYLYKYTLIIIYIKI